jgi:hypothetical protein
MTTTTTTSICSTFLKNIDYKSFPDSKPDDSEEGIYAIIEYQPWKNITEVIYVGRGKIRSRLYAHFGYYFAFNLFL